MTPSSCSAAPSRRGSRVPHPSRLALAATLAFVAPPLAAAQPASISLANRAYIRTASSPDFALQQFTVAAWLRPTGPGERGGGTLLSGGQRPGVGNFLCSWWTGWDASTGRVIAMVVHDYNTSGRVITSLTPIPLGQVGHAALSFDGVTLRLYINGVLDQSTPFGFTGVDYDFTPTVAIGGFLDDDIYTYNRFDGQLDDAAIWNRPLSATEIASIAACHPIIPSTGLVAFYPFTDQQLSDASGGGHLAVPSGPIAFAPQTAGQLDTCCPADFNNDGFVNSADFFDFLSPFFQNDPAADFNADGSVNSQDFFDFITALFDGCD